MVSFACDVCQDTIKKPKLDNHRQRCRGATFSCIDCGTSFAGTDYRNHTSCISEAEKYQKSLYKPKNKGGGNAKNNKKSDPATAAEETKKESSEPAPTKRKSESDATGDEKEEEEKHTSKKAKLAKEETEEEKKQENGHSENGKAEDLRVSKIIEEVITENLEHQTPISLEQFQGFVVSKFLEKNPEFSKKQAKKLFTSNVFLKSKKSKLYLAVE